MLSCPAISERCSASLAVLRNCSHQREEGRRKQHLYEAFADGHAAREEEGRSRGHQVEEEQLLLGAQAPVVALLGLLYAPLVLLHQLLVREGHPVHPLHSTLRTSLACSALDMLLCLSDQHSSSMAAIIRASESSLDPAQLYVDRAVREVLQGDTDGSHGRGGKTVKQSGIMMQDIWQAGLHGMVAHVTHAHCGHSIELSQGQAADLHLFRGGLIWPCQTSRMNEGHLQRLPLDVCSPEGSVDSAHCSTLEVARVGQVRPMAQIHHWPAPERQSSG